MEIKSKQTIACSGCGRIDVKHYAKKLCYNCYANAYYHGKVKLKSKKDEKQTE